MLNLRQKSLRFPEIYVLFQMTTIKAFLNFHFLILTSAWNILQFLELKLDFAPLLF